MTYNDIHGFVARYRNALPSFMLVTGDDDFLMIEASDAIRACARELQMERQVFEMNASSSSLWDEARMVAADIGMFASSKLIDIRIPGAKVGRQGPAGITKLLETSYEGVSILFTMPKPDWQTEKSAWWKALTSACEIIECNTPNRAQLTRWLTERLAKNQQTASREALEFLTDQIEGNLFAAAQEVSKLSLLFNPGELTLTNIQEAVMNSSHYEVDALIEGMELGQAQRVLRVCDALEAQGAPLPQLIAILSKEIRDLLKLQEGYAQGQRYVKGVFATPAKSKAARRLTAKRLKNALHVCADLDKQVKGLTVADRDDNPWLELKSIALFLAR